MSCRTTQFELASWSGHTEFSDDSAIHLDTCPRCRATFNSAFPPFVAPVRSRKIGAIAVAAAACLLMGISLAPNKPDLQVSSLGECIVDVEPWSPPECELG